MYNPICPHILKFTFNECHCVFESPSSVSASLNTANFSGDYIDMDSLINNYRAWTRFQRRMADLRTLERDISSLKNRQQLPLQDQEAHGGSSAGSSDRPWSNPLNSPLTGEVLDGIMGTKGDADPGLDHAQQDLSHQIPSVRGFSG